MRKFIAFIILILQTMLYFGNGIDYIFFEGKQIVDYTSVIDDMPEDKDKIAYCKSLEYLYNKKDFNEDK